MPLNKEAKKQNKTNQPLHYKQKVTHGQFFRRV